jgi:hypothetical protein
VLPAISPTPKSLLLLAADPLPAKKFFRITLLWLFTRQLPPHGAAAEKIAFLTDTTFEMILLDIMLLNMPLKQL